MNVNHLVNVVQPSGVLQDDIIINAIREKIHFKNVANSNSINYVLENLGARLIGGNQGNGLLSNKADNKAGGEL